MKTRHLSKKGPSGSAIGLGCMGMSEFYGETNDAESMQTLHHALDKGINFLDTADMYGSGHNEELVGKALASYSGDRSEILLATKFGIQRKPGSYERTINGRPEYVKSACEASLKRLQRDHIDLYYQHRVDTSVPIEETVGAMAELVQEGKVRWLGLSEASEQTIRRAHAVHPITALQTEYSLWTREVEALFPLLEELDIALVAYSPLGRGFLTGTIAKTDELAANDFRRVSPRFNGENMARNQALLDGMQSMATTRGVTPAQLALAWVLAQSDRIVPIPGTRKIGRIDENLKSIEIVLKPEEKRKLDELFDPQKVAGNRYPEAGMKGING
ncbi:MAG: aldo/keto reductase [Leptonema illini]|uniref:Aldo/keto reductase n=1 Tax=Leptonema illini TaxID=183 RepID=A0A833LX80_9LEPT|nr:MAG: aldo/keto reductase [Leptonema illini]